jgi:hypothetical protein
MGIQKKLDVKEPPVEILTPSAPPLQTQESLETVVERVLGRLIPGLLQKLGGADASGAMLQDQRPLVAKPPAAATMATASGMGATLAPLLIRIGGVHPGL